MAALGCRLRTITELAEVPPATNAERTESDQLRAGFVVSSSRASRCLRNKLNACCSPECGVSSMRRLRLPALAGHRVESHGTSKRQTKPENKSRKHTQAMRCYHLYVCRKDLRKFKAIFHTRAHYGQPLPAGAIVAVSSAVVHNTIAATQRRSYTVCSSLAGDTAFSTVSSSLAGSRPSGTISREQGGYCRRGWQVRAAVLAACTPEETGVLRGRGLFRFRRTSRTSPLLRWLSNKSAQCGTVRGR